MELSVAYSPLLPIQLFHLLLMLLGLPAHGVEGIEYEEGVGLHHVLLLVVAVLLHHGVDSSCHGFECVLGTAAMTFLEQVLELLVIHQEG